MPLPVHALIAVRGGPCAKSRCAPLLDAGERARLTELMFGDLMNSLAKAASIASIWVVTPTSSLAALAMQRGARVIGQHGLPGLDAAFAHGIAVVRATTSAALALLPGDLPTLTACEFDLAAEALAMNDIVVAPSQDGGTGAIFLGPGISFTPRFGADSGSRHVEAARAAGCAVRVVRTPGFYHDLDVPAHARALARSALRTASADFLRGRLAERA